MTENKITSAPCSSCLRHTRHEVLHRERQDTGLSLDIFSLIRCLGCEDISLRKEICWVGSENDAETHFYPSPVSRKTPSWITSWRMSIVKIPNARDLVKLSEEIYQAVDGGQHRLAAMGIRALLEQFMIALCEDQGGFEANLKAFEALGFISKIQLKAMRNTLEVGHAAMHRAFAPNAEELNAALDIVEGVFSSVFEQPASLATLIERVPPRARTPKKG